MDSCCEVDTDQKNNIQRRILLIAGVINLTMFGLEFYFGILANSSALIADSIDMFGDSFVYVLSFLAVGKSVAAKSKVALVNGSVQLFLGLGVLIEATTKIFRDVIPSSTSMGALGSLALVANIFCAWLLLKYRQDDINMKAVWICSRNDAAGNLATMTAAFLVMQFYSKWPDILVGVGMAIFIIYSSVKIIRESFLGLKRVN